MKLNFIIIARQPLMASVPASHSVPPATPELWHLRGYSVPIACLLTQVLASMSPSGEPFQKNLITALGKVLTSLICEKQLPWLFLTQKGLHSIFSSFPISLAHFVDLATVAQSSDHPPSGSIWSSPSAALHKQLFWLLQYHTVQSLSHPCWLCWWHLPWNTLLSPVNALTPKHSSDSSPREQAPSPLSLKSTSSFSSHQVKTKCNHCCVHGQTSVCTLPSLHSYSSKPVVLAS